MEGSNDSICSECGGPMDAPGVCQECRLSEALKDNFCPEAIAAIASYLDTANSTVGTNNPSVDSQVAWFAQELRTLVGGDQEYNRLCEEVGL